MFNTTGISTSTKVGKALCAALRDAKKDGKHWVVQPDFFNGIVAREAKRNHLQEADVRGILFCDILEALQPAGYTAVLGPDGLRVYAVEGPLRTPTYTDMAPQEL